MFYYWVFWLALTAGSLTGLNKETKKIIHHQDAKNKHQDSIKKESKPWTSKKSSGQ